MNEIPQTYKSRFLQAYKHSAKSLYDMSLCAFEVHDRYGYQPYIDWLRKEFNLSRQTGDNLLNVYRNIISTPNFSVENIMTFAPSALYLLAQPSTPKEAVESAMERATQGEEITHAVAKELVASTKAFQLAAVAMNNPYPPTLAVRGSAEAIEEGERTGNVTVESGKQVPVTPDNLKASALAHTKERAARQRTHIEASKAEQDSKPVIVCLCGSTRFSEAYRTANFNETLAGRIVLTIGCDMRSDAELFADFKPEELEAVKQRLDELHLRKIDLADEILVLNVDGYIGSSTKREIAYAQEHGKRVRWIEEPVMERG